MPSFHDEIGQLYISPLEFFLYSTMDLGKILSTRSKQYSWSDGQTTVCGQTNEQKRGATLRSFFCWKIRMTMGIYLVAAE